MFLDVDLSVREHILYVRFLFGNTEVAVNQEPFALLRESDVSMRNVSTTRLVG